MGGVFLVCQLVSFTSIVKRKPFNAFFMSYRVIDIMICSFGLRKPRKSTSQCELFQICQYKPTSFRNSRMTTPSQQELNHKEAPKTDNQKLGKIGQSFKKKELYKLSKRPKKLTEYMSLCTVTHWSMSTTHHSFSDTL